MTLPESIAMNGRSHLMIACQEYARIERVGKARGWTLKEIRIAQHAAFIAYSEEWLTRGWVTAVKFLEDNQRSELDFSGEVRK